MAELQAAATVVLVRDGSNGMELLLLKRPQHGSFANAWVFPGGRIEVADVKGEDDAEVDVARHAAERETLEETGLVVSAANLKHFSVWLPPPQAPRRFHTWFFIGAAPQEDEIKIAQGEIVEHAWLTPAEAIDRHQRGDIDLMPPTFVSISRFTGCASVTDALASVTAGEAPLFESFVVTVAERPTVVWNGDAEHPTSENTNGRHRLLMGDRPWVFERFS
ncbi:MAG: NUDIX hydrolase [Actinomycetota bacterium]|nr:NUDIX hydrolase [Actinomycetota bacterium]